MNILTQFLNPFALDTKKTSSTAYWIGLDIIRFIAIICVVYYHAYEILYDKDIVPFPAPFLKIMKVLTISIFTIIILLSFLYGLKPFSKKRGKRLFFLLPLGFIALFFTQGDKPFITFYTNWDIFLFLSVGILSLYFLQKCPKLILPFSVIGFILLWLPIWNWFPQVQPGLELMWENFSKGRSFPNQFGLKNMLIGYCVKGQHGGAFPIFPWIGLMWLCYGLGVWVKKRVGLMAKWRKKEIFIWLFLFIIAFPQWGGYYHIPMGAGFYCFMLRQSPLVFWSHFIVILFFIRLSLISSVNAYLSQFKIARGLKALAWTRAFGICYVTHFIFIGLYTVLIPVQYSETHWIMGTLWALVSTELFIRLVFCLAKLRFSLSRN